ncbi:MAG: hypothetical protein NC038_05050 [Paludibacter sp.]|nr:hypothetical protein [Bacteroidales bacterium]MCM1068324.1 hypothetical protein [Prevotella sp.]MCM1354048.1 hypothetical protein [Bacteroides sp.]MCM1442110.1 hypothetical protein [Muribaculum sp.]MCM1481997.1 hypothetical protein [Paludibacter sp.]
MKKSVINRIKQISVLLAFFCGFVLPTTAQCITNNASIDFCPQLSVCAGLLQETGLAYKAKPLGQRTIGSLTTIGATTAASSLTGFSAISAAPALNEQGIAVLPSEAPKMRAHGWNPTDPGEDDSYMNGQENGAPVGDALPFLLLLIGLYTLLRYLQHYKTTQHT